MKTPGTTWEGLQCPVCQWLYEKGKYEKNLLCPRNSEKLPKYHPNLLQRISWSLSDITICVLIFFKNRLYNWFFRFKSYEDFLKNQSLFCQS